MKNPHALNLHTIAVAVAVVISATPIVVNSTTSAGVTFDSPPDSNTGSDDMDHDGLTNEEELLLGTDPMRSDTDGGGVLDGWEVQQGFNPNDAADDPDIPVDIDIDNDGVLNEFEGENANDPDSDGDGISDANEIGLIDADNDGFLDDLTDINNNGMPDVAEALAVSLVYPDFDADGFPDFLDADSDNDGVYDKLEYDTSWVPNEYVGNPLDIDNDGQLNATDLDSDNDGVLDFDEQRVSSFSAPPNINGIYYGPTKTALGQIRELADDDGDGIPNQADANGGPDSDGDGIKNDADIDSPLRWNRQDDCVLYYCYLVQTYDDDGDGIQNEYDWDKDGDGALDFSAIATLYDTADDDGIPAIFDDDDQTAYVAPPPNAAPELSQPVPQDLQASAQQPLDLSIIAITDPDSDVLTFDLVDGYTGESLPDWLIFDPVTKLVTPGDVPSDFQGMLLNYIADDGNGGVLTTPIYITLVRDSDNQESEVPEVVVEPITEETPEVIEQPGTEETQELTVVPETNETPEVIVQSETDEALQTIEASETSTPAVGAANSSGGGAVGFWMMFVLFFSKLRMTQRFRHHS